MRSPQMKYPIEIFIHSKEQKTLLRTSMEVLMVEQGEARTSEADVSSKMARTGVLLVHGLNGSQRDMDEIFELLTEQGVVTESILLPGHGTHVKDMIPIGWPEWSIFVRDELCRLKERCEHVFLIGHSLGGSLCLHAAAHEEVAGVVTMCAPLHMFPWTLPAVKLAKLVTPILPTIREDVRDPEARKRYTRDVYRWTPMAPVLSMLQHLPEVKQKLPMIHAPALIMAAVHDHVVPVRDGYEIHRLLGSAEKELVILHRSYHVVMKDHDREEVLAHIQSFVRKHSA